MVLFCMTPTVVHAVQRYLDTVKEAPDQNPSLKAPAEGNPISHSQLIAISNYFKQREPLPRGQLNNEALPIKLDDLLRGCKVYTKPDGDRKPQSSEYQQLMARLRKDEETLQYERMLNQPISETFAQRFPNSPHAFMLAENVRAAANQEDEITYAEVNRQLALILNVLVSIIACGIAIWVAARHWSLERRLFLSMGGGILVGVAEVVIYMGYIRRLDEARTIERKKEEVLTVADSWVTEGKSTSTAVDEHSTEQRRSKKKP